MTKKIQHRAEYTPFLRRSVLLCGKNFCDSRRFGHSLRGSSPKCAVTYRVRTNILRRAVAGGPSASPSGSLLHHIFCPRLRGRALRDIHALPAGAIVEDARREREKHAMSGRNTTDHVWCRGNMADSASYAACGQRAAIPKETTGRGLTSTL